MTQISEMGIRRKVRKLAHSNVPIENHNHDTCERGHRNFLNDRRTKHDEYQKHYRGENP